jgi:serine/threonine protein kinase
MSVVYRAFDPVINRRVAIKVMAQRLDAPPGEYRRFLSELHLLGSLGHPNIVQVFDAGEHEGLPYIVMEYLEGENLSEAIQYGRCGAIDLKLQIAQQIALALQRVHAAAVCHRDVKPANVFLEAAGRAKLMDFGVSARLEGPRFTQTGALIGTLPYLAPEQIRGEKIGPAVDIYAFGILLFELFTGTKPFSGTAAEILYNIAHTPVPAQPLAGHPPRLADLIRSATAKAPADRPHDFAGILQVLSGISSETIAKRPSRNKYLWTAAAAAMAFIVAGWVWFSSHKPPVHRPPVSAKESMVAMASPSPGGAPAAEELPSTETGPRTPPADAAARSAKPNSPPPKLDLQKLLSTDRRQAPASPPAATVPDAPAPSTVLIGGTVAPQNPPPLPATTPSVSIPVAPTAVAAPDVSKTDHKNAEVSDSARRKAAPDEKSAPTSLPSAKPQNAADNREIRDVIER